MQKKSFLISLSIVSMVLMGISINDYHRIIDNTKIDFKENNQSVDQGVFAYLNSFSSFHAKLPYRYHFDEGIGYTYYNLGMMNSIPCINSFLSTVNNSVLDFYADLGIGRHTMTLLGPIGTNELLGARYVVSLKQIPQNVQLGSYKNENGQEIYLSENPLALPLGFTYERYITKSEFKNLPTDKRALAMLQYLVVPDEEVFSVKNTLKYSKPDVCLLKPQNLNCIINKHQIEIIQNFKTTNNSFVGKFVVDNNKYAFLSVPFSRYWRASVNGKAVRIININGFMCIPVLKGINNIHFQYDYLPLKWGGYCSIIGLLLLATYFYFCRRLLCSN